MPNQRKKGKKYISGYFDEKIIECLQKEALSTGKNKSMIVKEAIVDYLKERKYKVPEEKE